MILGEAESEAQLLDQNILDNLDCVELYGDIRQFYSSPDYAFFKSIVDFDMCVVDGVVLGDNTHQYDNTEDIANRLMDRIEESIL